MSDLSVFPFNALRNGPPLPEPLHPLRATSWEARIVTLVTGVTGLWESGVSNLAPGMGALEGTDEGEGGQWPTRGQAPLGPLTSTIRSG